MFLSGTGARMYGIAAIAMAICLCGSAAHAQFKNEVLGPGSQPAPQPEPPPVEDPVVEPAPAPVRPQPVRPTPVPEPEPIRPSTPDPIELKEPAAEPDDATPAETPESKDVEVEANQVEFDRARGVYIARGDAVVSQGSQSLKADYIEYNPETRQVVAKGRIVFTRPDMEWKGEKLDYNFRTEQGTFNDGTETPQDGDGTQVASDPNAGGIRFQDKKMIYKGREAQRDGDEYKFKNGYITSCTNDPPHSHQHVRVKEATVVPGDMVKARGVTYYIGRVPVFYTPRMFKNLDENNGWRFRPGYDSDMGAFLLSSYRHRMSPVLQSETHLDYRTERGPAIGQDFIWANPDTGLDGELLLYYLNDDMPIDDDEDPDVEDVDESRYRIKFRHNKDFGTRDYFISQFNYLSDTDILEDFFEDEDRENPQPENYAVLTHRGRDYTASVQARFRVNDFYTELNRLPQARFNMPRQTIGKTPLFYEGDTTLGQLEMQFAEGSSAEDYDSVRFDTEHTVYWPEKVGGFLNVIPRVGYRGTYYSQTREDSVSESVVITSPVTNFVVNGGVTNTFVTAQSVTNTIETTQDGGSDLRNSFEIGFETSFRAFKINQAAGRRHVVEPFANYTYVPEPNLLPDELLQFDGADRLTDVHNIRFGVRNKWQVKHEDRPHDLVDLEIFTDYDLDPEGDADAIDKVYFDCEFRFMNDLDIDFDSRYSLSQSELEEFNTRLWIDDDVWETFFEYRYRVDSSSLAVLDVRYSPTDEWSYDAYTRYEFDGGELEEQGVGVTRIFDCVAFNLGFSFFPGFTRSDGVVEEDDYRITGMMWLTEFPGFGLGSSDRKR